MAKRTHIEPMRYKTRDQIVDLLLKKDSKPGDQIPTEQELMEILDVSRSTLRESLHLLEKERIIRTIHGSGRYLVTNPKNLQFEITRLQSVTEMLQGNGIRGCVKVLATNSIPADDYVASRLEIKPGTPVLSIERLRLVEENPVIYSIDIIEKSKLTEGWKSEDFEGSLLKLLEEEHNIYLDYSRAEIRVLSHDTPELEGKVDNPQQVSWILLEQINYDNTDQPVIYSKDYHRGDFIIFNVSRFRY